MSKFEMPTFVGVEKGSDEYKAIISERNKIKKEATALVISIILENADSFDQDVVDAAKALTPKVSAGRTPALSKAKLKLQEISDLFENKGDTVDEEIIFGNFRYGRIEMRGFTRDLIKKADTPADRKWVSFDPETGVYTLEAIGEKAPKNWIGYIPPEISVEDVEDLSEDL